MSNVLKSSLLKVTSATTIGGPKSSFNIIEVPEMIFVETRFITEQAAAQTKLDNVHVIKGASILPPPNVSSAPNVSSIPPLSSIYNSSPVPTQNMPSLTKITNVAPVFKNTSVLTTIPTAAAKTCGIVSVKECGTSTEAPNPQRDRSAQTDEEPVKETASIEIQCNLFMELRQQSESEGDLLNSIADDANTEIDANSNDKEKEKFLIFCKEKTIEHINAKHECLVCGEVKSSSFGMQKHMSLHYGPASLCYKCGCTFQHESLMQDHRCIKTYKKRNNKRLPAKYKCPYYHCRVACISALELYDHINEHTSERVYRCFGCNATFHTAGELRHHLPLRLKCLEMAKRQRMPYKKLQNHSENFYRTRVFEIQSTRRKLLVVKSFLSQRRSIREKRHCQICLQYLSNSFMFAKHTKRCLKNFKYRLNKKRSANNNLDVLNIDEHIEE